MYAVTQDFIERMHADKRRVSAKVVIDYTDPTVSQEVQVTATDQANISYPKQTADNVAVAAHKWASLDGTWQLDQDYRLAPKPEDLYRYQFGWWSASLSGSDGTFSEPYPTLIVAHPPRPIYVLRAVGDSARSEWPVDFVIRLKGEDGTVLYTDTVTGNTAVNWQKPLAPTVFGVARQELEIRRWSHPGRNAKILEFFTSFQETYYSDDIVEIKLLEEREASQGSLPVGNISANEIAIRLVNDGRKFDVNNTDSPLASLLKPNRRIRAWLGIRADGDGQNVVRTESTPADWASGTLSGVVATSAGDLELGTTSRDDFTQDIRSKMTAASEGVANGALTISATGSASVSSDLWKGDHHARVLYVQRTGDFVVSTRVSGFSGATSTHEWSKMGIIVFDALPPNATRAYAIMCVTPGNGFAFQYDNNGDGQLETSVHQSGTQLTSGYVRLRRVGNTIYGDYSADGIAWTNQGSFIFQNAPATLYVGLFMTPNNYTIGGGSVTGNFEYVDGLYELYVPSGTRTSPSIDLSPVGIAASSSISWTATTPAGTSVTVETRLSLDGGATWGPWQACTNGGAIPGIAPGMDLTGKSLLVRQTLTTQDTTQTPRLHDLTVRVHHEEWVPLGVYWSLDWDSPDDTMEASVTARDRLELLRKSTYQPGGVQRNVSLYTLAEQVLIDAGLKAGEYWIDPALQQTVIPWVWLQPTSHREALRTIAEATLAVVYADRDGAIRVGTVGTTPDEPVLTITADDYFPPLRAPSRQDQVANEIIVTTQPLKPSSAPQEVYRSTEPVSVPAGQTVAVTAFYTQQPVIEASASLDAPPAGVSIVSATYYAWGADVRIQNTSTAAASVTLVITGKPLSVQGGEQVIARDEQSIRENGVLRYEFPANPLVQTLAQARTIAQALLASAKDPRRDIEVEWRGNPALELGDRVTVVGQDVHVVRQEIEWAGALSTRITGRKVT